MNKGGNSHQRAINRAATRNPLSDASPQLNSTIANPPLPNKNIWHWVADHPKVAGLMASIFAAMGFHQSTSVVGIWGVCGSTVAGVVFLILLIQEYTANTKHPQIYLIMCLPLAIPVLMLGIRLMPLVKVNFNDSDHVNIYQQYRIRLAITCYSYYLEDVGWDIPKDDLPPMVLSDDDTRAVTISQPYVGWMTINRQLVNDTSQGVYAYSSAIFGRKFIKDLRGVSDNIATRSFAAGIYANYFMYSYYGYTGDVQIAHTGWMQALWEIRSKFGKSFTDQLLLNGFRSIGDDEISDFRNVFDAGVFQQAGGNQDSFKIIKDIFKKYDLSPIKTNYIAVPSKEN